MPNPLNLVPNAVGQARPQVVWAQVSAHPALPSGFNDPLYVVFPQWDSTRYWKITHWPNIHGGALPASGADCMLVYDSNRALRCVWWDGVWTGQSVTGTTVGGDLSGTLPNPTVATVLTGQTPVVSTDSRLTNARTPSGTASGDLSGSYPSPNVVTVLTGQTPVVTTDVRLSSLVSSLPGSPTDGQIIDYQVDATNGIVWRFRYRSASASTHKWEFIGGPPLTAQVDTAETTASTTYAALTTPGPSVALPQAGDYIIEIGSYSRNATQSATSRMSYDIGATGAIDANGTQFDAAVAALGNNVSLVRRLTDFSAVTLTAKYRASAGTALFGSRYISAIPIRVG